ncbi:hypothetical protein ACVI8K_004910 [Bradyrhizobium barranii subsp. barranii]
MPVRIIGGAGDVQLALQIGLAMHGNFDAGGVEQRARGRDEDDGNHVAEQVRYGKPGIAGEIVGVPGQHEDRLRWRLKRPAQGASVIE